MSQRSVYRQRVTQAWDNVEARLAGRFDLEDVIAEAEQLISAAAWAQIKREFITGLVGDEDHRRQGTAESRQLGLFTGRPVSVDGYWALGGGSRVQVKVALYADAIAHIQLVTANVARVNAAASREQAEIAALSPYFMTPTTTVPQAVAAYEAAQRAAQAVARP